MEASDISAWVTAAKGALDLMRSGWQLLPRGDKKDELEANVRKAEEALQISSVSLGFGASLCGFGGIRTMRSMIRVATSGPV
jgi:hypothetical protein